MSGKRSYTLNLKHKREVIKIEKYVKTSHNRPWSGWNKLDQTRMACTGRTFHLHGWKGTLLTTMRCYQHDLTTKQNHELPKSLFFLLKNGTWGFVFFFLAQVNTHTHNPCPFHSSISTTAMDWSLVVSMERKCLTTKLQMDWLVPVSLTLFLIY